MKTLDRYILRSFLFSALLWFLVLMSLRIVVDLFVNMDEFTEGDLPFGRVIGHVMEYYGYQSLVYVVQMGGLTIVASAAFTLARMNHTNELTAMLASGVSLYRVVWPVILCAMLMGGLIIVDQELVIPNLSDKLVRERDAAAKPKLRGMPMIIDSAGTAWHAQWFLAKKGAEKMHRPVILTRDKESRLTASISGQEARPAELEGLPGWTIEGAKFAVVGREGRPWPNVPDTRRLFTVLSPGEILRRVGGSAGSNNVTIESVDMEDRQYGLRILAERLEPTRTARGTDRGGRLVHPRFVFTGPSEAERPLPDTGEVLAIFKADEARWIPRSEDMAGHYRLTNGELFHPTDLSPQDVVLRRSSGWLDFLSASQLASLLRMRQIPDAERVQMTRHVRFTEPVNNLIMLLLGLPFLVSRQRDIKASAGLCVLVVGAFYAFVYICRYIALSPALSAWLPILVFGGIAAVMMDSIKT